MVLFVFLKHLNFHPSELAVPPIVTEKAMELAGKAIEKQLAIMQQQQQRAAEFVDKKVKTAYRPMLFLSKPPVLYGPGERKDA